MATIYALANGDFRVETEKLMVTMNKEALLDNFKLDEVPAEVPFEAEPRTVQEYMDRRANRKKN